MWEIPNHRLTSSLIFCFPSMDSVSITPGFHCTGKTSYWILEIDMWLIFDKSDMQIWFSYFCPGICRFPRFPYIILNIPYNFLSGITTQMIQRNPTHLLSEYFTQDVRLVNWVVMKKKITPRNDLESISGIMPISRHTSYRTH